MRPGRIVTILLLMILITLSAIFHIPAVSAYDDIPNTFNIIYFDSVPYISMVELAETYRITISYDPIMLSMTVQRSGTKLALCRRWNLFR